MTIYSKYQYELRQSIAYALDDLGRRQTFTAQSGSSNSLCVCNYLADANDTWNGWDFHVFAGSGVGQSQEVSDFYNSNTTIAFSPNLTTALTTNSQFELHKRFSTDQYNDAINRAIAMVKDEYFLDQTDETTTFATDTYEYSIPSGFKYIYNIYIEDSTDANTYYESGLIDYRHWWIYPASTPKIKFSENTYPIGSGINGQKMRIVGLTSQSALSSDSSNCYIPPEYVIQQAKALLLEEHGTDLDLKRADRAQARANDERKRMRRILPVHTKAVEEY